MGVSDFSSSSQTEFNWNTNIAATTLTLLGTIGGQNAIMVGNYGAGRAVGLSFDWQDSPWNSVTGSGSTNLNRLLLNSIDWSAGVAPEAVPVPATAGVLGLAAAGLVLFRRQLSLIA